MNVFYKNRNFKVKYITVVGIINLLSIDLRILILRILLHLDLLSVYLILRSLNLINWILF